MFNNISELNNIELIELSDPVLNDKKKKIKKVILYVIGGVLYSFSLVLSTYEFIDSFIIKDKNCTCN